MWWKVDFVGVDLVGGTELSSNGIYVHPSSIAPVVSGPAVSSLHGGVEIATPFQLPGEFIEG